MCVLVWCVYVSKSCVCKVFAMERECVCAAFAMECVCGICYGGCVCIYVHMRTFKMIGMSLHNGKAGFD